MKFLRTLGFCVVTVIGLTSVSLAATQAEKNAAICQKIGWAIYQGSSSDNGTSCGVVVPLNMITLSNYKNVCPTGQRFDATYKGCISSTAKTVSFTCAGMAPQNVKYTSIPIPWNSVAGQVWQDGSTVRECDATMAAPFQLSQCTKALCDLSYGQPSSCIFKLVGSQCNVQAWVGCPAGYTLSGGATSTPVCVPKLNVVAPNCNLTLFAVNYSSTGQVSFPAALTFDAASASCKGNVPYSSLPATIFN